ncbi:iron dicitrate transport regulator FecR, partial [Agrobacterium sp. S2]|nr:iron dicitrate transport regulator FecR [Agrobacterium sp. S2]
MSSQPIDEEKLFREAMDLVIRLQEDPNNAVAHSLVHSWRSRSAAHEQMWEEASRLHVLAGKAVVSRRKHVSFQRSFVSRRKLMLGGAGLAAAAVGAVYVPSAVMKTRADYLTETAQLKQISLPDGTTATLGPDSALKVDFS